MPNKTTSFAIAIFISAFLFIPLPPGQTGCQEENQRQLSIEEAQNLAIRNSPELSEAYFNNSITVAQFQRSIRDFFPSLSIDYSQKDSVSYHAPDSYNKSLTFSLSHNIYDGGQLKLNREYQAVQLNLAQWQTTKQIHSIKNSVWNAYFEILVLQEKQNSTDELIKLMDSQLEIAETELELGIIRNLDYINLRIEKNNSLLDFEQNRLALNEKLYLLRDSLGLPQNTPISFTSSFPTTISPLPLDELQEELVRYAIDNNYDLISKRINLESKIQEHSLARTKLLPSINATLSSSLSGTSFPLQDPSFSAQLEFSFPTRVFPFKSKASIGSTGEQERNRSTSASVDILADITYGLTLKQQQYSLLRAQESIKQQEEELEFQIDKLIEEYKNLFHQYDIVSDSLSLERKKNLIMKEKLNLGEITRIDYLKELRSFKTQEIQMINSVHQIIQKIRALEKLLGMAPGKLNSFTDSRHKAEIPE